MAQIIISRALTVRSLNAECFLMRKRIILPKISEFCVSKDDNLLKPLMIRIAYEFDIGYVMVALRLQIRHYSRAFPKISSWGFNYTTRLSKCTIMERPI